MNINECIMRLSLVSCFHPFLCQLEVTLAAKKMAEVKKEKRTFLGPKVSPTEEEKKKKTNKENTRPKTNSIRK